MLTKLPTCILVRIARYLPAHNIACLAYTCKDLYQNKTIRKIWKRGFRMDETHCSCDDGPKGCAIRRDLNNHEPLWFCHLLERDMPGKFFCDSCLEFHSYSKSQTREEDSKQRSLCQHSYEDSELSWPAFHHRLRLVYVRYVFSEIRQDPHGEGDTRIEDPMLSWVMGDRLLPEVRYLHLEPWMQKLSLGVSMHAGSLVIRTSQRILLDTNSLQTLDIRCKNDAKMRATILGTLAKAVFTVCQCNDANHSPHLQTCVEELADQIRWPITSIPQRKGTETSLMLGSQSPHHGIISRSVLTPPPSYHELRADPRSEQVSDIEFIPEKHSGSGKPYTGLNKTGTEVLKCATCYTDYWIRMWSLDTRGVEILLVTSTNLGVCDQPNSHEWYLATNRTRPIYSTAPQAEMIEDKYPDILEERDKKEAKRQYAKRQEEKRQEEKRQEEKRQEEKRQKEKKQEAKRQEAKRQEAKRQEAKRQKAKRREAKSRVKEKRGRHRFWQWTVRVSFQPRR